MRLAEDEITIALAPRGIFVLRASLRAAFLLHRKYEGYTALSTAIADGSYSACDDLIRTCTDQKAWLGYSFNNANVVRDVLANRDKLLEFVLILAGGKQSSGELSEPTKPITFDEYHAKLFRIATGWLGWTPDAAWNATPSEIINAQQGRIEMLTAIFGGKNGSADAIDTTDTNARAELNALGDLNVTRMSEVR